MYEGTSLEQVIIILEFLYLEQTQYIPALQSSQFPTPSDPGMADSCLVHMSHV